MSAAFRSASEQRAPAGPAGPLRLVWQRHVARLCPVCGEFTRFAGFTANRRESGLCAVCGAFNRQRQMAYAVRRLTGQDMRGPFRFDPAFRSFSAEAWGPLARALGCHPGHVGAEYFGPDHRPGERIDGTRHEDLCHLSFAAGALDLVLSSDVLEHMQDPYAAHREIHRVLKPGGRHLFTVPFREGAAQDEIRACRQDGRTVHLAEPLYHADPVAPGGRGVLVWTIFGAEMGRKIAALGFQFRPLRLWRPRYGIIGRGALVFCATRRG